VAILIGLLGQALLYRTALGVNLVLLVGAVLGTAVLLRRPGARTDRLDLWIAPTALAFSAFVALRADPALVAFDTLAALGLGAAGVAAIGGARLMRRSLLGLAVVGLRGGALIVGGASEPLAAARPARGAEALRSRAAVLAPYLRGLLIALPVLAIFVGLFASADAVFSRGVQDVLSIEIRLGEVPVRLALAALVAWMVAGLLVAVARQVFPPAAHSLGAAVVSPRLRVPLPRLGLVEATVVLAAVDLLFAVFVGLQLTYLFGGRDTLAASGMTYSQYARRGFFELVAIAFLAGGLIAGLETVVAGRSRAYLASAVALAGLTLVVLASATLRLKLYQDAYGWTELRFYVYAAIAWLGLGAVATVVLLLTGRTRWLIHALGMLVVVVALAVSALGPQGFVARQNLARAIDPGLVPPGGETGLDAWYLSSLGDDAVPVMIEALPYVDAHDRPLLEGEIRGRAQALGHPEATAWPAWNLARERAREALTVYLQP